MLKKWFNSNAIHNLGNVLITLIAGGALYGFDWTLFGVSTDTALKITGAIGLAKILINAVRDGPAGMIEAPPSQRGIEIARQTDASIPKSDPVLIVTPDGTPDIVVGPKS